MIRMNIKLFTASVLVFCLFAGFGSNAKAFDLFSRPCSNPQGSQSSVCAASNGAKNDTSQDNVVLRTLAAAVNVLAFVGGVAAVIVIIISGFTMVVSGGNNEQVTSARRRIIYASVGLVVISLAWSMIRFVINHLL
jgi:hypothetical protein